jgi:hypothetical protein
LGAVADPCCACARSCCCTAEPALHSQNTAQQKQQQSGRTECERGFSVQAGTRGLT